MSAAGQLLCECRIFGDVAAKESFARPHRRMLNLDSFPMRTVGVNRDCASLEVTVAENDPLR